MYKNYKEFKESFSEYPDVVELMWNLYQCGRQEGYNKAMRQLSNTVNTWCVERQLQYKNELLEADGDFRKRVDDE